jgi:hypothetical protein
VLEAKCSALTCAFIPNLMAHLHNSCSLTGGVYVAHTWEKRNSYAALIGSTWSLSYGGEDIDMGYLNVDCTFVAQDRRVTRWYEYGSWVLGSINIVPWYWSCISDIDIELFLHYINILHFVIYPTRLLAAGWGETWKHQRKLRCNSGRNSTKSRDGRRNVRWMSRA